MQTMKEYQITTKSSDFPKKKIRNSEDSYEVIKQFWHEDIEIYESFFILLLNRANMTIGWAKISQGGITGTVVDVKILLKYVVDTLASGVIIAHNHPSGNLIPSPSDIDITKKVKEALSYLDSQLLDHLIITPENGFHSMADNGDF